MNLRSDLDPYYSVSALGYSAQGLVCVLVVSFVMLCYPVVLGFQRYPAGAPMVRTNSLAISAACHPLPERQNEAQELLRYGYIGEDEDGNRLIGFSSGRVPSLSEDMV